MARANQFDIPPALIASYGQPGSMKGRDLLFSTPSSVTGDEYAAALTRHSTDSEVPVSLYVHLPFCPVRCLNCDNNTTVTHEPSQIENYLDSLEREMSLLTAGIGERRRVLQLHLGGGSPNYLSELQLVRLASILERHFVIDSTTETSLDANPKRTSATQLDLLHGLGFRRVNFAVRDLDPDVQLAIGRVQSTEMIEDTFHAARDAGFDTVSMDLFYGLPRQTIESIEHTVEGLIELGPDRISCFSYTRHPAAFAHQRAINSSLMPSLADKLSLFSTIVDGLTSASYTWIGLDCFAKADDALSQAQAEGRLRRNWMGYTPLPSTDMFGFGTNAITDLDELCIQNHTEIPHWESALNDGNFPILRGVKLSEEDRKRRDAMTELMCNMELRDYAALLESDKQPSYLSNYARDGLLTVTQDRVSVTANGRYMLQHLWHH